MRISTTDKRESDLYMWDFRVNNNGLFQTFGNDAGIAMGLEWRQEKYKDDRDPRVDGSHPFEDGIIFDESDVIGMSSTADSQGKRDTYSAYAELYLPLIGTANEMKATKALEFQLALRYENPSDFSSTTKPKIGFRWAPVHALSIRGSYTEGFRAPNLVQLNQGTIARRLRNIEDPLREEVTGSALDSGDTYRYTTRLGNPNLQPEDAETTLIGFMFAPRDGALSGFQFGVDWWNIKTEDAVGILGNDEQMALDALLRSEGSFNPNVIRADLTPQDIADFAEWNANNPDDQREPVGAATNIISQYVNLEPREIEGYDAMLMYMTPDTKAGQFTFRGDMTKITKYEQQGLATESLLRRNGNPELRYTLSVNWQYKAFNTFLSARYIDDFYDTSLWDSGDENSGTYNPDLNRTYWDVDSWTTYNLSMRYDFGYAGNRANGLVLSGGIRNLTDELPPFADESFGYRRQVHNSYGRVWWLKVDYTF
jgi:outer membrane receptor for ferrienterochelin and colicin